MESDEAKRGIGRRAVVPALSAALALGLSVAPVAAAPSPKADTTGTTAHDSTLPHLGALTHSTLARSMPPELTGPEVATPGRTEPDPHQPGGPDPDSSTARPANLEPGELPGETAQARTAERTERDVQALRSWYANVAMWGLPILIVLILCLLGFRYLNRTRGLRAGGVGPLKGPASTGPAPKTATQLRAAEIHRGEYQNPMDELFDADEPEKSAWIVGHDGETLDFDWNEEIGFHDRRVERREKHPKDPRPDKPPTPDPTDGLRLDDAMLLPSPLSPPRPYLDEVKHITDQTDEAEASAH